MVDIGVFDSVARSMERLGYLKRLLKRVSSTATSNLENLGTDLVTVASQKIKVRLDQDLYQYIRSRIRGDLLRPVQQDTAMWLNNAGPSPEIQMELQDLYLADKMIPSQVGRLVKDNWRRYPVLGTNLGLVRKGTYSLTTRGMSFLYLTSEEEFKAFTEFSPQSNPMLINDKQALLLLYSFLENDGEIITPLWNRVFSSCGEAFSEKEAGVLIPDIYKEIIGKYRRKSLSINIRERLEILEKTADNINKISEKRYGGTSPLDTAVRPRIEPFVDIRIFLKKDPCDHNYYITPKGKILIESLKNLGDYKEIGDFLFTSFFQTISNAWEIQATAIDNSEEIVTRLKRAAMTISSSSGYAPIQELALLAGIEALIDDHQFFELGVARDILILYQKANPYKVRFTVDRLGHLAHVKFLSETRK